MDSIKVDKGWSSVLYSGCMKSGKTTYLYTVLNEYIKEGKKVILLIPGHVPGLPDSPQISRGNVSYEGDFKLVDNKTLVYNTVKDYDVVGIDEIQFFENDNLYDMLEELGEKDKKLVMAGLNRNFKDEQFKCMEFAFHVVANIVFLSARCDYCNKEKTAMYNRLVKGDLTKSIQADTGDNYKVVCKEHKDIEF